VARDAREAGMKGKTYFLSFVEECILNRDFWGYVGGRIEVYEIGSEKYAIEEIRFLTKKLDAYHKLRGRYDFEDVTAKGLERLRKKIVALNEKEKE
jgi:hypothetical protein